MAPTAEEYDNWPARWEAEDKYVAASDVRDRAEMLPYFERMRGAGNDEWTVKWGV